MLQNANQLLNQVRSKLAELYSNTEITFMFRHIVSSVAEVPFDKTMFLSDIEISEQQADQIASFVSELQTGKPLQYILGETEFYGLRLFVEPEVLIPRPETEELVHLIISHVGEQKCSLLDIGTGSGCIPISVAKNCPNITVSAFDISPQAIALAEKNARLNEVDLALKNVNILQWETFNTGTQYDIIVSNPPYVMHKEKELMHKNVLDHEPHLALFVEDNDPLIFYRTIADFAKKSLTPNGLLFFEINEQFGNETKVMLESKGFTNVTVYKDMQAKDRMISCQKIYE